MSSNAKTIAIICVAILLFIVGFWALLAIPTCTTYEAHGIKYCQKYNGPGERILWTEELTP